jgi:hypothetical protein
MAPNGVSTSNLDAPTSHSVVKGYSYEYGSCTLAMACFCTYVLYVLLV